MVCFFDCDDLGMTAAFREDVGEEETQLGGAGGGKTRLDGCAHGKRERASFRRSHRVSGPAARAHASASLREIDTQLASSLLIPRCRLACPSSRSCLLSSHFKLPFQESDSSSSNDFDFDHRRIRHSHGA